MEKIKALLFKALYAALITFITTLFSTAGAVLGVMSIQNDKDGFQWLHDCEAKFKSIEMESKNIYLPPPPSANKQHQHKKRGQ